MFTETLFCYVYGICLDKIFISTIIFDQSHVPFLFIHALSSIPIDLCLPLPIPLSVVWQYTVDLHYKPAEKSCVILVV